MSISSPAVSPGPSKGLGTMMYVRGTTELAHPSSRSTVLGTGETLSKEERLSSSLRYFTPMGLSKAVAPRPSSLNSGPSLVDCAPRG